MASFMVHITHSQIDIECELERYDNSYFIFLYLRAFDLACATVNLAAFATGHSATTVIDYFVFPNKTSTPIYL
jgi:hypothetical protein